MIALSEQQIESIEKELRRSVREIDSQICSSERALREEIATIKKSGNLEDLSKLDVHLDDYGKGVRGLRANLAKLEKKAHSLVEPEKVEDKSLSQKDKIADQIQKETHDAPATFSDFVKGLLMWRESPEDRMDA